MKIYPDRFYDVAQTRRALGYASDAEVRDAMRRGEIPFMRISQRTFRIPGSAIIELLSRLPPSGAVTVIWHDDEELPPGRPEPLPAFALTEDNIYRDLYLQQQGRCAICRTPHKPRVSPLVIDHDHATGFVRGLLCSTCNTAIGQLGDRVDLLQRAVDYLTESPFAARQITYKDMTRHRSRIVKPRRRKPKPSVTRLNPSGEITA